jgi:hypothetical protein
MASKTPKEEMTAGLSAYMANPQGFYIYTMLEDIGVQKKSKTTDYLIKASYGSSSQNIIVPRKLLSKNGKLMKEMAAGTKIVVQTKAVTRTMNGQAMRACSDIDFVVVTIAP